MRELDRKEAHLEAVRRQALQVGELLHDEYLALAPREVTIPDLLGIARVPKRADPNARAAGAPVNNSEVAYR